MEDPRYLSDDQLLERLDRCSREERITLRDFLAYLGEVDRRKLLEKRGYRSTFDYCVRALRLSEDEAYRRIGAARAAVSRPEILSALSDGQLSLTAISRIAPHANRPDAPAIIARAEGKSTRELEKILAPLSPEAGKRDTMRAVGVVTANVDGLGVPIVETRVDFSFRGSMALRDAIERARELLSHKIPFGAMEDVLLEVVRGYLTRHDPQTALVLGKTVPPKGAARIPAGIRRAVWARDGGRCSYVGKDGIRCQSRRMLELDHKKPRARGGADHVDNLRLLCRAHNDSERRRILGEGELSTDSSRDELVDNPWLL